MKVLFKIVGIIIVVISVLFTSLVAFVYFFTRPQPGFLGKSYWDEEEDEGDGRVAFGHVVTKYDDVCNDKAWQEATDRKVDAELAERGK